MRKPVTTSSLAGSFLIAHPGMSEPTFHRTVLMLADHDQKEGSFGLIINRPTGKCVGEILTEETLGHLASIPVLQGGPVQPDQLIFAAFRWHPQTSLLDCKHHISLEEAGRLATAQYHTVRAFVGYSGWSGRQLEGELAQRAWLVRRADVEDVLALERAPRIWHDLTATFGPWFQLVADAPDDPSLN